MKSNFSLWLSGIVRGLTIAVVFFFGTLFVLNYIEQVTPDSVRVRNIKSVMAALEQYYAANGAYPVLSVPDSPLPALSGALVGGGYISSIPADPAPSSEQTRYVSFDGKAFGLRVYVEKSGGLCIVEVRTFDTGWWSPQPDQKLRTCWL